MTSSPGANPVTPGPACATTPARSLPCPEGKVAGQRACSRPARILASPGLMPAALTWTSTWPGPGSGRGGVEADQVGGGVDAVDQGGADAVGVVDALPVRHRAQRAGQHEPVHDAGAIQVGPDDLVLVVDPESLGVGAAGEAERGGGG